MFQLIFFCPCCVCSVVTPLASRRAAGSKRVPASRIGGDDLEDDGYYDPDDVPDASFEHPDGTEEQLGSGSSGGVAHQASGKGGSSAKRKLSSKVVVF